MENKIKRNEFLKSLGFKGASLLAVYCGTTALSSCENESNVTPSGGVDFTVDLSNAAYSKLNTVGNYIILNKVVIARTSAATNGFAAVTQICSHEGQAQVYFTGSGFACPAHGATFSLTGAKTNNISSKGITAYQTSLSGTTLRVYS
jgi:nitrite reductase/ring-hydroxylating ferredoxin subunit